MEVNFKSAEQMKVSVNLASPSNPVQAITSKQTQVPQMEVAIAKGSEVANVKIISKDVKKLSSEDAKIITHEMNKFFQLINADLQFAIHEKTNQLMVQVVDTKENKVLREFPSHELLDTIANIREYVGVLLDKKV